jgi:hypothetical protein
MSGRPVLLFGTFDTAQSIETMTDITTRDALVRNFVLSGAACQIEAPAESKGRVVEYRGDYVHVVITEGPCLRTDGWTRTENVAIR